MAKALSTTTADGRRRAAQRTAGGGGRRIAARDDCTGCCSEECCAAYCRFPPSADGGPFLRRTHSMRFAWFDSEPVFSAATRFWAANTDFLGGTHVPLYFPRLAPTRVESACAGNQPLRWELSEYLYGAPNDSPFPSAPPVYLPPAPSGDQPRPNQPPLTDLPNPQSTRSVFFDTSASFNPTTGEWFVRSRLRLEDSFVPEAQRASVAYEFRYSARDGTVQSGRLIISTGQGVFERVFPPEEFVVNTEAPYSRCRPRIRTPPFETGFETPAFGSGTSLVAFVTIGPGIYELESGDVRVSAGGVDECCGAPGVCGVCRDDGTPPRFTVNASFTRGPDSNPPPLSLPVPAVSGSMSLVDQPATPGVGAGACAAPIERTEAFDAGRSITMGFSRANADDHSQVNVSFLVQPSRPIPFGQVVLGVAMALQVRLYPNGQTSWLMSSTATYYRYAGPGEIEPGQVNSITFPSGAAQEFGHVGGSHYEYTGYSERVAADVCANEGSISVSVAARGVGGFAGDTPSASISVDFKLLNKILAPCGVPAASGCAGCNDGGEDMVSL